MTSITPTAAAPDRVRIDSRRKTALAAGMIYLITSSQIPTLSLYVPVRNDPNHPRPWPRHPDPDRRRAGGDRGLGLHRHRRRVVPGGQAAARRSRAGLRRRPGPGGRHHLRRGRQPADGGDVAAVRSRSGSVADRPGAGAFNNWTFLLGQSFLPVVNALLLGSLLYRSRLVPLIIPLVGLIGAPLLLTSDVGVLFGLWPGIGNNGDRGPPDRGVGVLAGRLPGRQGLQTLDHRRGISPAVAVVDCPDRPSMKCGHTR